MPKTAVNITAPRIAHTTGKVTSPISITKISGRFILCAIHVPNREPINPTAIEIKQPPLENPARDLPIEPEIPAIISKIINSRKDIIQILI